MEEIEESYYRLLEIEKILKKFKEKGFTDFEKDIKKNLNRVLEEYEGSPKEKSYVKKQYSLLSSDIKNMKKAFNDDVKEIEIIAESLLNLLSIMDDWYDYSNKNLIHEVSGITG